MSDVAKAAKVSITTVGRVIHNNGFVSDDVRARVEKAIQELEYIPNRMARALKQQKSGIIGSLVVYNQNNLYQRINSSVIKAVENNGYKLITMEGRHNSNDEGDLIDQFIGMQVDGLVITSNGSITSEMFDRLHSQKIPVVAIERTYDYPYIDGLVVKDFEGAYSAVKSCINHGHRRIALISSRLEQSVEKERYRGYTSALADNGIELDTKLIYLASGYSLEEGCTAMKKLLAVSPTAVFCTADTFAAGAMQVLYQCGKKIPDDISIIGYDNVLSAQLAPPINSVDLAIKDIGETVLSMLKRRMADINAPSVSKELGTVYVDRGTVAAFNPVTEVLS